MFQRLMICSFSHIGAADARSCSSSWLSAICHIGRQVVYYLAGENRKEITGVSVVFRSSSKGYCMILVNVKHDSRTPVVLVDYFNGLAYLGFIRKYTSAVLLSIWKIGR